MKLDIDILIISNGHSGVILQNKLFSLGHKQSIIIQEGQNQGYIGKDVIMFSKQKLSITYNNSFEIHTNKYSSGAMDFLTEYSIKLYNREPRLRIPYKHNSVNEGYLYNNNFILRDAQIYGNIIIDNVDIDNKIAKGHIVNSGEIVSIYYNKLCFANGIHKLQSIMGILMLKKFGLFISYFPVGIKKIKACSYRNEMNIEYFSDPNIPYYRKHHFKDDIFYEYCLNKKVSENMNFIISPGRFLKPDDEIINSLYDFCLNKDIYLFGRFATWEPDYLLEHIWNPDEKFQSNKILIKLYEEINENT